MTTTTIVHPASHTVRVRRYDLKTGDVRDDTILLPGSPPYNVCVWDGIGVAVEEVNILVVTPTPAAVETTPASVSDADDSSPE